MANDIIPIQDIERMAGAVAQSGLFGIKTKEQALSLMLIAQAEGMHPAIAARDYHIIQGRPALRSDAMLARFQAAGGKVKWTSYTDHKVSAIFSHPAGGEAEIEWTTDRAKAAGLAGRDNWKNYPRQMLRARVVSEGIRTVFPGVVVGIYTPEEAQDFDEPKQEPKPTPCEVIPEPKKAEPEKAEPQKDTRIEQRAKSFSILFEKKAKATPLDPKEFDDCRLAFLQVALELPGTPISSKTLTNEQFDSLGKLITKEPKLIDNFISSYIDKKAAA